MPSVDRSITTPMHRNNVERSVSCKGCPCPVIGNVGRHKLLGEITNGQPDGNIDLHLRAGGLDGSGQANRQC